jgi:hypothetical protein
MLLFMTDLVIWEGSDQCSKSGVIDLFCILKRGWSPCGFFSALESTGDSNQPEFFYWNATRTSYFRYQSDADSCFPELLLAVAIVDVACRCCTLAIGGGNWVYAVF